MRQAALLERDRQLLLATPIGDIEPLLAGPAAIASWFAPMRRSAVTSGDVVVELPDDGLRLHARESWHPEHRALLFEADRPPIRGFVTFRSVILPEAGIGTEIWIHLETPASRQARRQLAAIEALLDSGLAHMAAELDRV